MNSYVCAKCGYNAGNKSHYDRHINKKNPCSPHFIHGNIKKIIDTELSSSEEEEPKMFHCEICDVSFRRKDLLKRHIEQTNKHANNVLKIKNCSVNNIHGNNNTIDNSINKTVINNGPIINITFQVPHDYTYNNIKHLTLFEQFKSISNKDSPYSELLANLNFHPQKKEYHNINYNSLHSGSAKVYTGSKEIEERIRDVLDNIVSTKRDLIHLIFNRFRCFLSVRGTIDIRSEFYKGHNFGDRKGKVAYNQLIRRTKMYLYNNRTTNKDNDDNEDVIEEIVPDDDDDDFWWALDEKFVWKEVSKYMTKMDQWNIDFSCSLINVKKQLIKRIDHDKKESKFFAKLFERIDDIVENCKKNQ